MVCQRKKNSIICVSGSINTEALEGHFYLLLITYYLLLITYHLLLITYYLLLITYYLLLTTYYLLLITYHIISHPYNGGKLHCTFPVIAVEYESPYLLVSSSSSSSSSRKSGGCSCSRKGVVE